MQALVSTSCIDPRQLIDLYPPDVESSVVPDLSLRRMFCDFLGGSLLIVLARGCDGVEDQVRNFKQYTQA